MKPITVDPITLAKEIINGRRLTREDDLSYFITCDLDALCKGADIIYNQSANAILSLRAQYFLTY